MGPQRTMDKRIRAATGVMLVGNEFGLVGACVVSMGSGLGAQVSRVAGL